VGGSLRSIRRIASRGFEDWARFGVASAVPTLSMGSRQIWNAGGEVREAPVGAKSGQW